MVTEIVDLDLSSNSSFKIITMQGDIASRFIEFHLTYNNETFDLTGKTVSCRYLNDDKTTITTNLVINDKKNGICTLDVPYTLMKNPYTSRCELVIKQSNEILSTIPFTVEVVKSLVKSSVVESSDEFGALNEALWKIDGVKSEIEKVNSKIEKNDSQLDNIAKGSLITNKHDKPLLSIIFDDGVRNVFTNGREWFKANNVNIGLAIHNNTFQKKQLPTQLEVEEISILLNDGHEILSHGYKDEYLNTELSWAEWLIKGSVDMYRDYGINCRGYVPAGGIILDKYLSLVRENFDYAFCNYSNEEVDYEKDKYHINRIQIDTIPYSVIEPILINVASKKGMLFLFSHDLKTSSNECDNINSIAAIINKARELGYDVDTPNNCLIKAGVIDSYDRKNKNYRYNLLNDKTFDSWNFLNHADVSSSNIIKDYKSNPLKNIRCGINNSKVGEYITLLGELDIELSDVNMFGEFSFKLRNELGKRGNKISVSLMGYNEESFVKYLTYHEFVIGTDGEEYDNSVKFGVDKESLVNKIKINITLTSEYEGSFICRLSEPYLSLYQY